MTTTAGLRFAASVVANRVLYGQTWQMLLDAPGPVRAGRPGQFVMLRCADARSCDPLLPRALSIAGYERPAGRARLRLLYDVVGRGTAWMTERTAGDAVEVTGPLGHAVRLRPGTRHLLLVAGGIGIAPFPWMAALAAERGVSVTVIHGARTAEELLPPGELHPEVELVTATEDGSAGVQGRVTDALPDYLDWADEIVACGPVPMFRAMAGLVRRSGYRRPVHLLMEEIMACGTGICYSCAVETRRGVRLVCKDGPVFELRELF